MFQQIDLDNQPKLMVEECEGDDFTDPEKPEDFYDAVMIEKLEYGPDPDVTMAIVGRQQEKKMEEER